MKTITTIALAFALSSAPVFAQSSACVTPPVTALPVSYTLELQHGSTIDFADVTQTPPGALRGYVLVRYQGEPVWIPVYRDGHRRIPRPPVLDEDD